MSLTWLEYKQNWLDLNLVTSLCQVTRDLIIKKLRDVQQERKETILGK